jgi:hypothetical protein
LVLAALPPDENWDKPTYQRRVAEALVRAPSPIVGMAIQELWVLRDRLVGPISKSFHDTGRPTEELRMAATLLADFYSRNPHEGIDSDENRRNLSSLLNLLVRATPEQFGRHGHRRRRSAKDVAEPPAAA